MDRLASAGLADVILIGSANNLAEIQDAYPDTTTVEQENLELGMRGALLSALPHCKDESVLIVSGNDVFDPSAYTSLQEVMENDSVDGAILAQEVEQYFPGGYLTLNEGNRIAGIAEKPGAGNEPSNLVNIVAHAHRSGAALLEALQDVDESTDDGYEQALDTLFADKNYQAVPYTNTWQAVKYPWHLLSLLPVLLEEITEQSIHPTAQVHETAVITGNVVLEEGVKVMPHATVVGPCYIGRNSIVANNALARQSSVGDNCVVGYNTEVKGSVLHSHVWTHMTYIGDSVIGRNVSFGAGSVTGNLRLDEAEVQSTVGENKFGTQLEKCGAIIGNDCRLGIQTGTNPGIKIGSGSFVSSNVLVEQDVPEKQFVRLKEGVVKISENKTEAPQPEDRGKFKKKI